MKKLLAFFVTVPGLLIAGLALAAILTVNWQNATTNTDGSAIPASGPGSLTETRIEYGTCNAARTAIASVLGTITVPGTATTAQSPDLGPGVYCARAQHVNTYGVASDWSNVASREILAPKPNPPSNFGFG